MSTYFNIAPALSYNNKCKISFQSRYAALLITQHPDPLCTPTTFPEMQAYVAINIMTGIKQSSTKNHMLLGPVILLWGVSGFLP